MRSKRDELYADYYNRSSVDNQFMSIPSEVGKLTALIALYAEVDARLRCMLTAILIGVWTATS